MRTSKRNWNLKNLLSLADFTILIHTVNVIRGIDRFFYGFNLKNNPLVLS